MFQLEKLWMMIIYHDLSRFSITLEIQPCKEIRIKNDNKYGQSVKYGKQEKIHLKLNNHTQR